MAQEPEDRDAIRSKTTGSIWWATIPMLTLSIPLTAIMHDSAGGTIMLLPLSVIAAAAFGTAAVWNPFRRRETPVSSRQADKQIEAQTQQINELNERVASLEQILNYEEKLLDAKLRGQHIASQPTIDTQPLLKETPLQPEPVVPNTSISTPETIVRDTARSSRYAQEKSRQRSRIKRESA